MTSFFLCLFFLKEMTSETTNQEKPFQRFNPVKSFRSEQTISVNVTK